MYKKRALPVAWMVVKGHVAEDMHIALLEQVAPLIPEAAEVVFLGDEPIYPVANLDSVARLCLLSKSGYKKRVLSLVTAF